MNIFNPFLEDLKKIYFSAIENEIIQMEFLVAILIVTFILWICYKGLNYKKIQEVFCKHFPDSEKSFLRNSLNAPLLSGNGIAMWRVYCSIPLAILTFIFYKETVVSSILLQFYVFLFVSDALDGAVSRKLGNVTELGKSLDPFADKFLDLIILLIVCCFSGNIYFICVSLSICLTDIIGQTLRKNVKNPAANWVGKTKTVFKVISIYLISLNRFDIFLDNIGFLLLSISLIFTIWSCLLKIRWWNKKQKKNFFLLFL